MFKKKYNSIMQKPEEYRNKVAFFLSAFLTLVILAGFVTYKGYLGGSGSLAGRKADVSRSEKVASSKAAPSPISNTKRTVLGAMKEVVDQYNGFTSSVSAVLVPFFTGIEVYERK